MTPAEKAANARKVTPLSLALAAQLKAERAYAGITVEELQKRSRIAKNTLAAILNGTKPADVSQLSSLCDALGVGMAELFARTEERMRTEAQRDRNVSGR
jgi:transcriptional regulator with XRE-family HTH domain